MAGSDEASTTPGRRGGKAVATLGAFLVVSTVLILFNAAAAPSLDSTPVPRATITAPSANASPAPLAMSLARSAPVVLPVTVVTLGDSVPAGTACNCTPFGSLVAASIGRSTGAVVTDINDSVSALGSAGLLAMVSGSGQVAKDVAKADVVMIEIGANDVDYLGAGCGTGVGCYTNAIATMTTNVDLIVKRILKLNARPALRIILINYWDVWEDGQVASDYGTTFEATAHNVTAAVNQGIASVAVAHKLPVVDLVVPFEGTTRADDTYLLAADGNHPNAAGHRLIASAILSQVPGLLTVG